MRNDLGVRLGLEDHASGLEGITQIAMVLDDAVLNDRDRTVLTQVRMRIAFFGFAVGGPAGVADSTAARRTLGINAGFQIDQLAPCLQAAELTRCIHRCNSGGVVAAVFQLSQAFKQQ